MRDAHEPRLARVAAMVADPARSRMLASLMTGEYASASELTKAASVAASTASGHLGKLLDAGFLFCEPRGRHRYHRLADAGVAHALEAMALFAERNEHDRAWAHPERQRLRYARCCDGHMAGRLAVPLHDTLHCADGLKAAEGGYELTPAGLHWLAAAQCRTCRRCDTPRAAGTVAPLDGCGKSCEHAAAPRLRRMADAGRR